jgi:two-component system cell cycle sensor histidine kinase/response regulator CckA
MSDKPTYEELEQRLRELEKAEPDCKRTEDLLADQNRLMNTLLDNLKVGVFMVEAPSGKPFLANRAAIELLGRGIINDSNKDNLAKIYKAYKFGTDDIYPADHMPIVQGIKGRSHTVDDMMVVHPDGSRILLEVFGSPVLDQQGKVIASLVSFSDITEHKQSEVALRHNEELLNLFVKHTPAAVAMCDRQMRYLSYSDRWAQDYGLGNDNLVGRCHYDLFPDLPAHWKKEHQRCFDGEKIKKEVEPFPRKDGSTDWVRRELCPWHHRSGDIGGLIIFTEVITDKKQLEDQLRQNQKMEAIGTLAGGIAHNFNNILMGIQGQASLISFDLEPSHPHAEHVEAIEESIRSATHLTKQLLGFARGGKYEVRPIDINELLIEGATMFGSTKKEIHIHTKFHSQPIVVEADRRQVEQALLNLYINAWQAMPDGGKLYLETKIVTLDDAYCKPYQVRPGCYAKVSVTDTGIGMDESVRQQVFDPFFTTKDNNCGTGLGLASVYGIIKNHAGIITVKSQAGQGTKFNIYLPISQKKIHIKVSKGTELVKGSETVLLVEDEEKIIQVGEALLERLGYQVIVAKDSKQAIDTIEKQGDRIDLVILDLTMPGMGGGRTFDLIRVIQPSMPVILSSGYSVNGQVNAILRRGCNEFIQKPFTISELSQKVRKTLDEAKGPANGYPS